MRSFMFGSTREKLVVTAGEHIIIMTAPSMPILKRGGAHLPLYHQLKTAILREIQAGRWKPGDRLPTEDELIARFHVSKITVRQALRELAEMGYIRRAQGRGTFVLHPPLEEGPRELTSFTGEMRGHGRVATSRVIDQAVVAAPADIASRLGVAPARRCSGCSASGWRTANRWDCRRPTSRWPWSRASRCCRSSTRRCMRCSRRATRCGPRRAGGASGRAGPR